MMHGQREYRTEKRISTKRKIPVEMMQEDMPDLKPDQHGPWGKLRVEKIVPSIEEGKSGLESTARLMIEQGVSIEVISFNNSTDTGIDITTVHEELISSVNKLKALQKQLDENRKDMVDKIKQQQQKVQHKAKFVLAAELRINFAEALSIAFDGSRYYLMCLEKGTEY